MKRILVALLMLFAVNANAQFVDDFNRADEPLEDSANWTDSGGAGQALVVDNNRVESDGTELPRFAYFGPAQSSADFYVEADILYSPALSTNNESLAIRIVDNQNYIRFERNNVSNCIAGIREASNDAVWLSSSPALCDNATRMRIEAEGTTIRFYLDDGGGMTLYHTETGVTTFQSSVLGGFASTGATGNDGVNVWDNFEMDELAAAEFDSGPTLDDCNAVSCTFDFTTDIDATVFGVFCTTNLSAPTGTQVVAGNCGDDSAAKATCEEATTGTVADSCTLTPSDSPVFPLYDAHFIACPEPGVCE